MNKLETCTDCFGNCSRCGNCCTISIPITKEEESTIRKYIKKNNIKPVNLFENGNFYAYCCFYDRKNHKCNIYDVRPSICKSFKCNRDMNDLEKEKVENHKRAYWNHIDENNEIKNITTFDLLFYDDPRPLLTLMFRMNADENGNIDEKKYKTVLEQLEKWGQSELAKSLHPVFEKDMEVKDE